MQAARVELPPALKKNGKPGKRPQVRYRCAICGELFSQKNINVDHIETVVLLWKHEKEMTYDEIVRRIFCDKGNLQVVCSTPMIRNKGKSSCHKKKTDEENWVRKKWLEEYLTDVWSPDYYETTEKDLRKKYKQHLKEKEEKKNAKKARKRK